ncbi:MAG TPA: XRE family transcriptional regulator [Candidatus Eisenbacteria bacterium]
MDEMTNGGAEKAELGRRIREARQLRGMTLKEMDESAGLSATHISEIERGKTSPTIGALIRIAAALGREASFFVEPQVLPDIARTSRSERFQQPFGSARIEVQTPGVPGGRLKALTLHLEPSVPLRLAVTEGSIAGYIVTGGLHIDSDGSTEQLGPGDSVHVHLDVPVTLTATGAGAEVFVVTTADLSPAVAASRPA